MSDQRCVWVVEVRKRTTEEWVPFDVFTHKDEATLSVQLVGEFGRLVEYVPKESA